MLKLGICIFAYSFLASILLQLVVIPRVFSHSDAVQGLVVLDSMGFDRIARSKAVEIMRDGWAAWELRPQGQSPAGIASVFYSIWNPVPYSLLPFNALVHAVSACLVFSILRMFYAAGPALLGAGVFALNPAAMEWVAQIHRDGVFILGNLLFIFGMMRMFGGQESPESPAWRRASISLLLAAGGVGVVWIARPYWVQVMMLITCMAALVLMAVWLWRLIRQCNGGGDHARIVALAGLILMQVWLARIHTPFEPVDMDTVKPANERSSERSVTYERSVILASAAWTRTWWLPVFIDERLYRIAISRRGALSQGGNSVIDPEYILISAPEVFSYVPRALQIGLLGPFPNLWHGEASTPAMTIGRKVVGAVTFVFYVCLLGAVLAIREMRCRRELWVLLGACVTGVLVYAVTYPNLGTLVRYRYGFYMLLVAFGAAFWTRLLFQWKMRRATPLGAE